MATPDTESDEVRVQDCLYSFCKRRNPECWRCDAVKAVLVKYAAEEKRHEAQDR